MTTETGDMHIKLTELHPNPYQPPTRLKLAEEKARKGGESILRSGLIQIPVCRAVDKGNGEIEYQIGDGWQRHEWFAWLVDAGHRGYDRLPVTFRPLTDQQMADLIEETDENKEKLNVMEKAWLWHKKLADFKSLTQADIARQRGISQGEVANTIRLLDLPEDVQQKIITQEITPTHGRSLLQLKSDDVIRRFAALAIENKLTVADLDSQIKNYLDMMKPKMEMEPAEKQKPEERDDDDGENEGYAGLTANERAGLPRVDENTPAVTLGKSKKKQAAKPVEKKPAAAAPAPAPAKPAAATTSTSTQLSVNWGRKLVIEEKKDHVIVSVMKAGGIPSFKKFEGCLADVIETQDSSYENPLVIFMAEVEAQWLKEGKK